jgi:hypothetical protein
MRDFPSTTFLRVRAGLPMRRSAQSYPQQRRRGGERPTYMEEDDLEIPKAANDNWPLVLKDRSRIAEWRKGWGAPQKK